MGVLGRALQGPGRGDMGTWRGGPWEKTQGGCEEDVIGELGGRDRGLRGAEGALGRD